MEIWRDVEGYEGRYSVSNQGNVRSNNYHREQREQLLIPSPDKDGYLRVLLYLRGFRRTRGVHQLVAEAFLVPDAARPHVNHKDTVVTNNHDWNLEWCTNPENNKHAILHGLIPNQMKGAHSPHARVFQATSPDGVVFIFKGLKAFCISHGLLQGEMSNVVTGRAKTHRGWTCIKL